MTRNELSKMLPVMQAYAKGKTIEICCDSGATWVTDDNPSFNPEYAYRVKPEPKCRPFENREECWEEMQKHQPVGWLRTADYEDLTQITYVGPTIIGISDDAPTFLTAFEDYKFADGAPFGVKLEY